ncbi:lecithin retinol acyltransferase b, tandem duplicate 2 [Lampris incognitus]|uniref:lecithin retinol acyltransferase b, tandem duplicate 2 n=1 Tax=Lampris incognitus TaxID=2546036 RepID=UPI0024B57A06|nr:lecithin retinol acyltransferase b, tandem duplicate 2 [Lampris incognitus]
MFPLRLIALLFITVQENDQEEKEWPREKDREKNSKNGGESKYDLRFQRGDLLEVPRTLFTHFGIYLGGGRVAHLIPDILPVVSNDQCWIKQMVTNNRLIMGVLAKCASVRVDSVDDFAYGSEILINKMDKVCSRPPLPGEEVARRAEKLQGSITYSLLWYNCEHFVMYCRYGTAMSFQTFQFCKTVRKMVLSRRVAKVTAVLGVGLILYLNALSVCSILLVILLPFLIWMAS